MQLHDGVATVKLFFSYYQMSKEEHLMFEILNYTILINQAYTLGRNKIDQMRIKNGHFILLWGF